MDEKQSTPPTERTPLVPARQLVQIINAELLHQQSYNTIYDLESQTERPHKLIKRSLRVDPSNTKTRPRSALRTCGQILIGAFLVLLVAFCICFGIMLYISKQLDDALGRGW